MRLGLFLAEEETTETVDGFMAIFKDEQTLITALISTGIIIIVFLVIIFILRLIVKKYMNKNKGKRKHAVTLANLLFSLFKYILLIVMFLVLLGTWGINVTPILAGAGIVALGVSLGAQKFISDLINGMCIVFENYYDVDDVVEIDGFKGRVLEVSLKSTKIINWKNEIKVITNGSIINVINYSRAPSVALVEIEIGYNENIDKVVKLLDDKLIVLKDTYKQIIEGPYVNGVTDLGDDGVKIGIIIKTEPEQYYEVVRAIKKYVKELFDEENINIPYKQLVVHNENK